jgi:dTDP-4-amino-4,6-dideoxygalactose transaminase
MFYLLLPSPVMRQAVIDGLKARGILSVFHYVPLHLSPMGVRWGASPGHCPVAERTAERLVRLPFYNDITESEQAAVVAAIRASWPKAAAA